MKTTLGVRCPLLQNGGKLLTISGADAPFVPFDIQERERNEGVEELLECAEKIFGLVEQNMPHPWQPIEALGEMIDVVSIPLCVRDAYLAFRRRDRKALVSCLLKVGEKGFGLAGALTGHPSLIKASIGLKVSKSVFDCFCPSFNPNTPVLTPTASLLIGQPILSCMAYDPATNTWKYLPPPNLADRLSRFCDVRFRG
jgi:hypothetical protein